MDVVGKEDNRSCFVDSVRSGAQERKLKIAGAVPSFNVALEKKMCFFSESVVPYAMVVE